MHMRSGPKAVSNIKGGSFGLGFFLQDDSLHVVENVLSAIFLLESASTVTWTLGNHQR